MSWLEPGSKNMKHDDSDLIQFLKLGIGSVTDMYLWSLARHATQSRAATTQEPCFFAVSSRGDDKPMRPLSPQPGATFRDGEDFPELVVVVGGSFEMGGRLSEDEGPIHAVHVEAFAMGKYPVTQGQWTAVMGGNPSLFKGNANLPVENVSWFDAQAYVERLSLLTGRSYHLPTEAQFEYACRSGCSFEEGCVANEQAVDALTWNFLNSNQTTHPVGEKKPNAWGLYDMLGNVWEWCEDVWHDNYLGAPVDGSAWIDHGSDRHVLRGGSWYDYPFYMRCSNRIGNYSHTRFSNIGFRVARFL